MVVVMFAWQKLVDARGVKREVCDLREVVRTSGLSRQSILLPGYTTPFWQGFLLAGLVFVTVWKLIVLTVFPVLGDIQLFSVAGLMLYGFLFVFPGMLFGIEMARFGWRSPQHAIDAMIRVRLCPSCGYSLYECEPKPDGCTVCPECGAAWRLEP